MAITCKSFTNFLSRRAEHLDDQIIRDITPVSSIIGMVETGPFPAMNGTSHTYDRFNRVFPDLSGAWEDVEAGSCVGTPCDPSETKIGFGFTRDEYRLQQKSYTTDLFCYDQILSADRAKEQFAHTVEVLRDATQLIIGNRLRSEMFRIAGYHWVAGGAGGGGLTAFTFTETGNLINVVPSVLPTSKLTVNMLKRRLQTQILNGATGKTPKDQPPELEVLTDMETIWELIQGDSNLTDKWFFTSFDSGSKEYNKYGWAGRVGNFMLKADLHPVRFQILADGTTLNQVFPYTNVAATQGIKGIVNDAYVNAPIQAHYIWHRRGMKSLLRDATSIHPMMAFAARDFAGKWQFVMDNLTCGTDVNGNPIAVDNTRRNKGKFIADFEFATKKQFPEFVEVILALREPACIVEVPVCTEAPTYVTQDYSSANDVCDTEETVLTFLPIKAPSGNYEIVMNSIQCNGIAVVHSAINESDSLAELVIELNDKVGALGTWAVSGSDITLTGTACTTAALPWTEV